MQDMPDPAETAVDITELAAELRKQRAASGMSLRQVAAETGVPYSTLARVESGKVPDLATFRSIVAWLGIAPERFFPTPRVRSESTPEFVAHVLRSDPALTDQAREQLAGVFSQMYAALTVTSQHATVQLRAERAFTPDAGNLLADILAGMEKALLGERST
jgi:transcriptional regulator with XRE-family HTH domain